MAERLKKLQVATERTQVYLSTALASDIRVAGHFLELAAEASKDAYLLACEANGSVPVEIPGVPRVHAPAPRKGE